MEPPLADLEHAREGPDPAGRVAREPGGRGGDDPIRRAGRRETPEQRRLDRQLPARDRRLRADLVGEVGGAVTPDVRERRVAVGKLARRQAEHARHRAGLQAQADHDRARRERHHHRQGRRPRDDPGRRADPHQIGAAVRQDAVAAHLLARADHLRPDAQHVTGQRRRRQPLPIGRARHHRGRD